MTRRALRAGSVVIGVVVSLAATVMGTSTASAVEPCRLNMVWAGSAGEVNASFAPNRFVQWGARSYGDDTGLWLAYVVVGRRTVDRKKSRAIRRTVASIRKDLRSGRVLRFLVYHVDSSGNKSVSRPDAACLIP